MAIFHIIIGLSISALSWIALLGIRRVLDNHKLKKMARDCSRPDNTEVLNVIRDWRE
jgi:hypothetical protein